ncbi:MAG: hypothetical protein ACI8XD_001108, partial [Thermoproteota archaeon]
NVPSTSLKAAMLSTQSPYAGLKLAPAIFSPMPARTTGVAGTATHWPEIAVSITQ